MKKTPIMDISAPVVSHNLDAQEHEREVVLMALRWPSDSAPFYAKLVEPMAVPPQRTWVMVEYEPPAKTRRSMGLPRKPGCFTSACWKRKPIRRTPRNSTVKQLFAAWLLMILRRPGNGRKRFPPFQPTIFGRNKPPW